MSTSIRAECKFLMRESCQCSASESTSESCEPHPRCLAGSHRLECPVAFRSSARSRGTCAGGIPPLARRVPLRLRLTDEVCEHSKEVRICWRADSTSSYPPARMLSWSDRARSSATLRALILSEVSHVSALRRGSRSFPRRIGKQDFTRYPQRWPVLARPGGHPSVCDRLCLKWNTSATRVNAIDKQTPPR